MCLYNTSFPLESVIVAVDIVEPNLLCAFSSPSFRFPFFSFLNIFPEQFSPQALDRAEKCREEREREWQRQRERAREEEREAEDYKATSLKGNLVQSLNKDKRKLNSEGAQPRCLGELGEHRAGNRSDVGGQPTQGEEEIHVGGRSNRMDAGVGWTGPRAPGSPSRSDPRRVHAAAEVGAAAGGAPAFVHGPRFLLEPWGSLPSHSFASSFFSSSPSRLSPSLRSFLSREILGQRQPSPAESCQSLQLRAFIPCF